MTVVAQDSAAARKRRVDRLRQVLVELDREPAGLEWPELWRRVAEAVPLVDDDHDRRGFGIKRGVVDLQWTDVPLLDRAGWVLSGVGPLRITPGGRQALRDYPDAESLDDAANRAVKARDALRQPPPAEPLPLGEALAPTEIGEPVVLAAARLLLEEGLRDGGSAFAPGRPVWSPETVAILRAAFVDNPDLGAASFLARIQAQLRDAGDDAILLAAEMLSLVVLPLSDWKPDTKRQRVKTVLAMMAEPVHMSALVSAAMEYKVFGGGIAFKTMIWKALSTVIEVATAWWRLDDAGRDAAWQDPWAWRDLINSTQEESIPSVRSELCYLLHPGTFPPIVSGGDRARIRDAFADEVDRLTGDVDRDILAITLALQIRSGGPVDFYMEPFYDRWRPIPGPVASRRAWLVRPGQAGVPLVARWSSEGYVSVMAKHLGEVAPGSEPTVVRAAVDAGYGHVDYAQRLALANEYHSFLSKMADDDVVVALAEDRVHVGVIAGDADYPSDEPGLIARPVTWSAEVPKSQVGSSVTPLLSRQGTVVDLTAGLDALVSLLGEGSPEPERGDDDEPVPVTLRPTREMVPALPPVTPALAQALHMPQVSLQEIVEVLQSRQQVVFYGPPGTGKTYLARKLAEHLVGGEDPSRAQLVQFHPSYAYEDFFEGFRPAESASGQATFTLQPGPLRLLASEAAAEENRGAPFVLIIDEMNRANLAKVFGELYFLLEYRNESIRLQYQPTEAFRLPKNLFVIGTMNTADRSIALVDAAIRRRFAFVELHPDTEPVRGVLPSFLAAGGFGDERAKLLAALNRAMDDTDRDFRIGPSYLMRSEAATPEGLDRIWKYDLLPLLEEHYYGRLSRQALHERFGLAALQASLAADAIGEDVE